MSTINAAQLTNWMADLLACVDTVPFRVSARRGPHRLTLNTGKTKEIVFRHPQVKYFHMPPAIDCIEDVNCCKLLGVFFSIQS